MIGYGGGGGGGSLGTYNGGDGIHGGGNGSKEGDIESTAGINGKGGGGGGSIILQNGLKYEYYNQGYFRDNVNWFNSYNPHSTGYVTNGTNIETISNNKIRSSSRSIFHFNGQVILKQVQLVHIYFIHNLMMLLIYGLVLMQ